MNFCGLCNCPSIGFSLSLSLTSVIMMIGRNAATDDSLDVTELPAVDFHLKENKNCSDVYGNFVLDGMQYVPDNDPCRTCHCHNGQQVMCKSVQCSPPTCRYVEMIKTECCKFICIDLPDEIFGNKFNRTRYIDTNLNETNANRASFGVRLVASIVTSSLIVFLLIFMLHRLRRRRRMMINIRRLNNERRIENDDLTRCMTTTNHLRFELPPYEDLPPPPYSPIKPWGGEESPPPYERPTSDIINRTTTTTTSNVINTTEMSLDVNRNLSPIAVNNVGQSNSRRIEEDEDEGCHVNLHQSEDTNDQENKNKNGNLRQPFEMINTSSSFVSSIDSPLPTTLMRHNNEVFLSRSSSSRKQQRDTTIEMMTRGKKCFVVEDELNPTSKRKKNKRVSQKNSNESSTFLLHRISPTLLPPV